MSPGYRLDVWLGWLATEVHERIEHVGDGFRIDQFRRVSGDRPIHDHVK